MQHSALALALLLPAFVAADTTSSAPASLTLEQKEAFLKAAKVKQAKGAKKGVTSTVRATLVEGEIIHDASIQRIDDEQLKYETARGTEYNFRDTYKFNIAAYKLGCLLGLDNMIPPSVERSFDGKKGAWTWWIEDVQMDDAERMAKKIQAPDKDRWSRQYLIMKVFDQLIHNTDRNATNILYDKNWKLWMIDHSRAFRLSHKLLDEKALERCDRVLLTKMKALDEPTLKRELGPWLRPGEIKAILIRRDLIVAHFEQRADLLYDFLGSRAVESASAPPEKKMTAPAEMIRTASPGTPVRP